jgi:hypothetical protein
MAMEGVSMIAPTYQDHHGMSSNRPAYVHHNMSTTARANACLHSKNAIIQSDLFGVAGPVYALKGSMIITACVLHLHALTDNVLLMKIT